MKITNICIHHFGGLGNDNYASTQHLTETHINNAHKARWPNFPSELNGSFIGYNEIIWADGTRKQYRLLGEETAAVKGHNSDTYHIALAGNFTEGVNKPTQRQVIELEQVEKALIKNEPYSVGIKIKPGTEYSFSVGRIYSHRIMSPAGYTTCYGDSLSDDWAKTLAMPSAEIQNDVCKNAKIDIIDKIILFLSSLKTSLGSRRFGVFDERDDEGVL